MIDPGAIKIERYNYDLPNERIAKYPLSDRDRSKLLVWRGGEISETHFDQIDRLLPEGCQLYFNETRVVQARLQFKKPTGAAIEVFCLEPVAPTREIQLAFEQKGWAEWRCFVGNMRRWKAGKIYCNVDDLEVSASCVAKEDGSFIIRFEWSPETMSFSELLLKVGKIPLPPYLNREAEDDDLRTYQTVYARVEGSVAAPTAGLHFTPPLFERLKERQIEIQRLVLHVGAGTFKPVDSEFVRDHQMHVERILLTRENLNSLLDGSRKRIVVGTTSVRTLESLYWYGVKLCVDGDQPFSVNQWDPYNSAYLDADITLRDSVLAVLARMDRLGEETLSGETSLMIAPGYKFRVLDGIITNFHQPKSTLLLLVSALLGEEWKRVYDYALDHDFRFLSYGDSCLFFKP